MPWLVTLATAVTMVVAAASGVEAAVPNRQTLLFRVEGSRKDPEFGQACGVVKGLEDLYGTERYRLVQVRHV